MDTPVPQQGVDQGGLPVVHMRNDGDISGEVEGVRREEAWFREGSVGAVQQTGKGRGCGKADESVQHL